MEIDMERRHSDALDNRLEQIISEGCTYISWNELYLWYDTKAIAAATYRDIHARWAELSKGHKTHSGKPLGSLVKIHSHSKINTGIFLFGANMPKPLENPDL